MDCNIYIKYKTRVYKYQRRLKFLLLEAGEAAQILAQQAWRPYKLGMVYLHNPSTWGVEAGD